MLDSAGSAAPGTTVLWVDTDDQLAELIDELSGETRLAIDTEFHRERTYYPTCALVQIAWSNGSALIDPVTTDVTAIGPLLTGRTIVMHASGQDLELFRHSIGVLPDDLFDTQVAASFLGMSSVGLGPLVRRMLDVDLPKADRLTDWLARPLPEAAKAYAASDVAYLFEIFDLQAADLEARGRQEWVRSECAEMVTRALTDADPDSAWWRVKEARRLKGRAAAIAQEVAKWREQHAREVDRPLRSVLPDLALAGIAQRPPKSENALTRVRGLRDRGIPKAVRADLLDAVERGRQLDLGAIKVPEAKPVPSELRAAVPLLMSWVSQRARELDLDPAVLATRSDLEDFLRGDGYGRLGGGWRREALATDITDLLQGKTALSFKPGVGLVMIGQTSENGNPALSDFDSEPIR